MSPLRGEAFLLCLRAIDQGLIPADQRDRALAVADSLDTDETSPQALVRLGLLTPAQLAQLLAEAQPPPTSPPSADPAARTRLVVPDEGRTEPTAGLPPSPPAPMAFPRPFGKDHVLVEVLGRGGMGMVYRAWQQSLRRHVALKVMRPSPALAEQFIQRFQIEARAAARLRHPNIVSVHQVGVHEGEYFFTMDLVDGPALTEVLRSGRLSRPQSLELLEKVARAVHYAHQHGIVHRDLKPGNILVDSRGEPMITDFGLAKDLETEFSLSLSNAVMGTPSYMSPEQARGRSKEADARSDVYSLGAVLYEMLVGRPPFQADTSYELLRRVVEKDPPPPRSLDSSVPADVETICLKCLCKEPDRRYPTAEELAGDLRRFLDGQPIAARPSSFLYVATKRLRRYRGLVALGSGALLAILGLLLALLATRAPRGAHTVGIASESVIQAFNEAGQPVWRRDMAAKVGKICTLTDRGGRPRFIVGLEGGGPAAGSVVAFDARGKELWRFRAGDSSPHTGDQPLVMAVTALLVDDVLPEPGSEIILTTACQRYPGRVCILSEDGRLLRHLWHPGDLGGVVRLAGSTRLVFWGSNNALRTSALGDGSNSLFSGIFCLEADKVDGQCPPWIASDVPRADLLWYKALTPQGRSIESVTYNPAAGPKRTQIEVSTTAGWYFWLDADGQVLQRGHGDVYKEPPTDLLDVLAKLKP